jgi:hypothetical protein
MNAFANPEEAFHYDFPEFPKPEDQVTEYSNIEGVADFQLKDFVTSQPFDPREAENAVVQPVVLQDFKEVIAAAQS